MSSLNHSLGALLLVENPEGILQRGSNQGQVPFPVVRGDVTRLQDNQKGLERGSYQTRHQQPTLHGSWPGTGWYRESVRSFRSQRRVPALSSFAVCSGPDASRLWASARSL